MTLPSQAFTDTRFKPYWWEDVALDRGRSAVELPDETDILIVGGGYAGCSAALTLAQSGARVVIVDAWRIGEGASSRNGGQVVAGVKRPVDELATEFGGEIAELIQAESEAAFDFFEARLPLLERDVHYGRCGAFAGAHSQQTFASMKRRVGALREARIVEPDAVGREVGTSAFYGGMVRDRAGQVHPALYHEALADACIGRGVRIFEYGRVVAIRRAPDGFQSEIEVAPATAGAPRRCAIRSRQVLVATNGYTPRSIRWLASRIVPVSSHMIATEPLRPAQIESLIPGNRIVSDTRRMLSYFRLSPDRTRMLFGGRASFAEIGELESGKRLFAMMCRVFPELCNVRITHSWRGNVAFARDLLPHFGVTPDGIHYTGPFNGRGVALGTYLGHRVALRMQGRAKPGESLDALPHDIIHPGYGGRPWFFPFVGVWYHMQDTAEAWRSAIRNRRQR